MRQASSAVHVSIVLCALWAASAFFAYLLGRQFLSPMGAAVFALLVTFNPATLHFSPGKDPSQLLTINAMLWAWFAGRRRRSASLSALAGALLMVGMVMGLIHLWVALAAVLATGWDEWRMACVKGWLMRQVLPAAGGAGALVAVVYLTIGWNMPATFLAVNRRFAEMQQINPANRTLWFFIGLPLFLLFLSPGFWAMGWLSIRRWTSRVRNHGSGFGLTLMAARAR